MNKQKPEPRAKDTGETLDLHSMFGTIQGEGPFTGHRAIFIRLAGCNLKCPGCDTEYTHGRRLVNIDVIVSDAVMYSKQMRGSDPRQDHPIIVITGGEPLRQTIGPLVRELTDRGFIVQIESNGVFEPDKVLVFLLEHIPHLVRLVISPKTSRINPVAFTLASCFKYVLAADSISDLDGLPIKALDHPASTGVARPRRGVPVYVNPYDEKDFEKNRQNLTAAAESAARFGYILGVQLHKIIGYE